MARRREMRNVCIVLVLGVAIAAVGCATTGSTAQAGAGSAQAKIVPQTDCPVTGAKISKQYYADYEGKRVYFCCSGCIEQFKKDPAKYMKKMEDQGITLENSPAPAAEPTATK
jgi:YHS domain-containing protein